MYIIWFCYMPPYPMTQAIKAAIILNVVGHKDRE